jgi:hypothetical protein
MSRFRRRTIILGEKNIYIHPNPAETFFSYNIIHFKKDLIVSYFFKKPIFKQILSAQL